MVHQLYEIRSGHIDLGGAVAEIIPRGKSYVHAGPPRDGRKHNSYSTNGCREAPLLSPHHSLDESMWHMRPCVAPLYIPKDLQTRVWNRSHTHHSWLLSLFAEGGINGIGWATFENKNGGIKGGMTRGLSRGAGFT